MPASRRVTGYCRVSGRDADGDSADDGVLIGNIPYVTLGVPYNEALDGWKHRFTYAVTETMTDSATFIPTRGAIMVWKADGSTPLSFGDPANPNANPKHQNGQGTAHFVYFSHGENGRGSYSIEGIRIGENCDNGVFTAAEVAAAGKDYNEIENCDNDYEFTWDSEAYSTQQGYDYTMISSTSRTACPQAAPGTIPAFRKTSSPVSVAIWASARPTRNSRWT